jgi:hypothetical protein
LKKLVRLTLAIPTTFLKPLPVRSLRVKQWKRISRKQSARWQHLSWLKASAFFSVAMEQHALKCEQLFEYHIYSYLETSGGQNSNLYLNVHFFNTGVN